MADSNSGNTVKLHRVFKAPADRVYRAFLEPGAKCKWLLPHGFVGTIEQDDMKAGGSYRMSLPAAIEPQPQSACVRASELIVLVRHRRPEIFTGRRASTEGLTAFRAITDSIELGASSFTTARRSFFFNTAFPALVVPVKLKNVFCNVDCQQVNIHLPLRFWIQFSRPKPVYIRL